MPIAVYSFLLNSFIIFLTSVSFVPVVLCLSFNYTVVGQDLFPSQLIQYGNVSLLANAVQVTYLDQNPRKKAGRIFYKDPVTFWSASTGQEASFNCSFRFQMSNLETGASYGDGLAFLLVDSSAGDVPVNSTGRELGIVDIDKDGNASNKVVAVEFDTFQNPALSDPNSNHIGVDINSVISVKTESDLGFDLKSSTFVYAWIDYNSSHQSLVVYATNISGSKPGVPLLSHQINLSQYLPSSVLVGFSAATGASYEIHTLYSWSFSVTDIGSGSGSKNYAISWIVGTIVGLLVLAIVVAGIFLARRKHRHGRNRAEESDVVELPSWTSGPKKFTYRQLSVATKNFHSSQQLGQGGFGSVYKGILPEDGSEVAVKRISQTSKQGEKEFRAEVTIISRIRHRNLVELKGWCHEKGDLLLVYEYLPNRSLDYHLFEKNGDVLDWSIRYKIVCELGGALQYLHEECERVIIHRDVKASNVMLDAKFNAKLGDFGLARQLGEGVIAHTTLAAGTIGYLAPECHGTGKAMTESDVFSYGAVLLEVACGRRPADMSLGPAFEGLLVNWVWSLYGKGQVVEAVDVKLGGEFDEVEASRMLAVGLACSHPDAKSRPTIRQALESLQGRSDLPPLPPSKPVAYYGPPPPLAVADLFSKTSSAPPSTTSTNPSSIGGSPTQSLLHSIP